MIQVEIHLDIDVPTLYQFGYSTQNNIRTVSNWQAGNATFLDVPEGAMIYFFVENIYLPDMPIMTGSKYITCSVCEIEIQSVSEEILTNSDPLVDDWEDIVTEQESNPLADDWEDVATNSCEIEIQIVTELIL